MSIDVDGTLRNPAVAIAFGLWCVLLIFVGINAGFALRRRNRFGIQRCATLVMFLLISRVATRLIAMLFYVAPAQHMFGVGFWGSPPVWAYLTVAILATAAGLLLNPARSAVAPN